MEGLSLLKYWRSGGLSRGGSAAPAVAGNVATTLCQTDHEESDEGPFFDLEFAVPVEDDEEGCEHDNGDTDSGEDDGEIDSMGTDGEREFNFTVSSGSSCGPTDDPNLSLSPSDDLFFKGRLVPFESTSSDPNSKTQFPVSFLKSVTMFQVFMLGLKRQKSMANVEKVETNVSSSPTASKTQQQQQSKSFTVKCKAEEVPIVSLLTRENSSRSSGNKVNKQATEEVAPEDKKFSKDVLQRYLKMIKPLYVRVSKRYGDKMRFSGQLSFRLGKTEAITSTTSVASPSKLENKETDTISSNVKSQKQGNLPAGLLVVCKHLGKSRSASSAVAAAPTVPFQTRRRDDSLLQQQDGIQGAILHCKRSFNATTKELDSSQLLRCTSDPSLKKSVDSTRNKGGDDRVD